MGGLEPGEVDARIGVLLRRAVRRGPAADGIAIHTTDLGSMFMVVGSTAVLLAAHRRRAAALLFATGTTGWTVGQGAKGLFNRLRPYEMDLGGVEQLIEAPTGSSFPSGHATVAAAVGTLMRHVARPGRRWPWVVLAVWVPITRVHVGVHYPSDVVAGAGLGWLVGRVAGVLADRWGF